MARSTRAFDRNRRHSDGLPVRAHDGNRIRLRRVAEFRADEDFVPRPRASGKTGEGRRAARRRITNAGSKRSGVIGRVDEHDVARLRIREREGDAVIGKKSRRSHAGNFIETGDARRAPRHRFRRGLVTDADRAGIAIDDGLIEQPIAVRIDRGEEFAVAFIDHRRGGKRRASEQEQSEEARFHGRVTTLVGMMSMTSPFFGSGR